MCFVLVRKVSEKSQSSGVCSFSQVHFLLTISLVRQLMACSTVCFCFTADDDGEELEPCRKGVVGQPGDTSTFLALY